MRRHLASVDLWGKILPNLFIFVMLFGISASAQPSGQPAPLAKGIGDVQARIEQSTKQIDGLKEAFQEHLNKFGEIIYSVYGQEGDPAKKLLDLKVAYDGVHDAVINGVTGRIAPAVGQLGQALLDCGSDPTCFGPHAVYIKNINALQQVLWEGARLKETLTEWNNYKAQVAKDTDILRDLEKKNTELIARGKIGGSTNPAAPPVFVQPPDTPVAPPVSEHTPDKPVAPPVSVQPPDTPVAPPVSVQPPDTPVAPPVSANSSEVDPLAKALNKITTDTMGPDNPYLKDQLIPERLDEQSTSTDSGNLPARLDNSSTTSDGSGASLNQAQSNSGLQYIETNPMTQNQIASMNQAIDKANYEASHPQAASGKSGFDWGAFGSNLLNNLPQILQMSGQIYQSFNPPRVYVPPPSVLTPRPTTVNVAGTTPLTGSKPNSASTKPSPTSVPSTNSTGTSQQPTSQQPTAQPGQSCKVVPNPAAQACLALPPIINGVPQYCDHVGGNPAAPYIPLTILQCN